MSDTKIQFINHASFTIESKDSYILLDPWFSGRVFNDSWSLIKDTDLSMIDFDKLTHVVVSHEHPDHLHFPSLKKILSKTTNNIKFLFPARNNENVEGIVSKIGYDFEYLIPREKYDIDNLIDLTCFKGGHDAALIFNIDGKILLNQNDCNLDEYETNVIRNMFPDVDALFLQYSLAGYYGNRDNPSALNAGRQRHIDTVSNFCKAFSPKTYVPFASFVYFCKEYNKYLNDWVITPEQLRHIFPTIPMQVLYYGDYFDWDSVNDSVKNEININKFKLDFESEKSIIKPEKVEPEKLISTVESFFNSLTVHSPAPEVHLEIVDHLWNVSVDLSQRRIKIIETVDPTKLSCRLPAEDVVTLFKFPWGADTINISATFDIINKNIWHSLVCFIGDLYKR